MLAWHYTVGANLELILKSGFVLPARSAVEPPQKPILWFTLRQDWDPSANKLWAEAGTLRRLDVSETAERGGGLVRLGLSPDRLIPWRKLRTVANVPPTIAWRHVELGKQQGSDPSEWLGSLEPVAINTVEAIDAFGGGEWVRIAGP